MIELQSIYRNSFKCIHPAAILDPLTEIYFDLLVKPYFNLNSYGKRAFSVAAPELFNNLPEDIKSANSIDDFKRKLKTFLFMRAYES